MYFTFRITSLLPNLTFKGKHAVLHHALPIRLERQARELVAAVNSILRIMESGMVPSTEAKQAIEREKTVAALQCLLPTLKSF